MSKIISSKSKISRKYGVNLWGRPNDAFVKKPHFPGQHAGKVMRSRTPYRTQLVAKQKLKFFYCVSERKLRNLAREGIASMQNSVEYLVGSLERLLSCVVYRAGFASTMFFARQIVSHGHVLVNGKPVNINTYRVSEGDVISLAPSGKKIAAIKAFMDSGMRVVPEYYELNKEEFSVVFKRIPKLDEVKYECPMTPEAVLEFYSK